MVPVSGPGMDSWGNLSGRWSGALRLSPLHGEGEGAFFVRQRCGPRYPSVYQDEAWQRPECLRRNNRRKRYTM
jgi:hypothetical protein